MGFAICLIAAFPMALLGIIPQSIVADIAESEAVVTGEIVKVCSLRHVLSQ